MISRPSSPPNRVWKASSRPVRSARTPAINSISTTTTADVHTAAVTAVDSEAFADPQDQDRDERDRRAEQDRHLVDHDPPEYSEPKRFALLQTLGGKLGIRVGKPVDHERDRHRDDGFKIGLVRGRLGSKQRSDGHRAVDGRAQVGQHRYLIPGRRPVRGRCASDLNWPDTPANATA